MPLTYNASTGAYTRVEEERERLTLETVLTSPEWFGLTTASPLQRAICRLADGLPLEELKEHQDVVNALGCVYRPAAMPAELYVLAAIRTAKSLLAAALAVRASQVCDLSGLRAGETPRIPIVSLKLDLANVVYHHLLGAVHTSPRVRELLVGDPTADGITLQHPSGAPVEIKCVAGARAGASIIARWLAAIIFDEFTRMVGSDDGKVVNFDDARKAALGRLLKGAQIIGIGSPWAPFGPAYKLATQFHGKPSQDRVVVRATGPMMWPEHWTPERCEELKRRDPIAYKTDVLGEFADAETSMFGAWELESLCRRAPDVIAPQKHLSFVAAIDPAAQTDAFSLVVMTRIPDERWKDVLAVALVETWEPPLSPDEVLGKIATLLRPYGITTVHTDQWSAAALQDLGRQHGLNLEVTTITAPLKVDMFESLKTLVADRRIQLPPSDELLEDLRRVKKKVTATGVRIEFPRVGGRHCDLASALALACAQHVSAPGREVPETIGQRGKRELIAKMRREAREWE